MYVYRGHHEELPAEQAEAARCAFRAIIRGFRSNKPAFTAATSRAMDAGDLSTLLAGLWPSRR